MKRKSALELIDQELRSEVANGLGRAAAKLVEQISELEKLHDLLVEPRAEALTPEQRAEVLAKYDRGRDRADELRLHLIIQREAIGLRDHRLVYATYVIPRKIH